MHGLAVHVKKEFTFAQDLSLENSAESYISFRLAFLHSVCLPSFASIDHILRCYARFLFYFI